MQSVKIPKEAQDVIERLLRMAHLIEMSDHAVGKIVAKTSFSNLPKVMSILQDVDIDKGLSLIPGLKGYSVSVWSRTATINYDPTILLPRFWEQFFQIKGNPSIEESVRENFQALFENLSS
jgi:Zn-dependent M28 family amino/carboxypeptidase